MQPKILSILGAILFLLGGLYLLITYGPRPEEVAESRSYMDAQYTIAGVPVKLVDGVSEVSIPESSSKIITRFFGNEVHHDLNGDGREDVVFLMTQETGGTGTFFYVVAALNTVSGYSGSHALLLGDRIAPQTTELSQNPEHQNVIVVNYADRNPGEPMTTPPSQAKSIWLKFDVATMTLGEVVQNFEGEADPARMTLEMKKWSWASAAFKDGRQLVPMQPEKFSLTLSKDGTFSASTDCNGVGGEYAAKDGKISFTKMMSTKMFCEGSQEAEFSALLEGAETYRFTSKGELILELTLGSGSATFR
jgi:heat shock protein HslJ